MNSGSSSSSSNNAVITTCSGTLDVHVVSARALMPQGATAAAPDTVCTVRVEGGGGGGGFGHSHGAAVVGGGGLGGIFGTALDNGNTTTTAIHTASTSSSHKNYHSGGNKNNNNSTSANKNSAFSAFASSPSSALPTSLKVKTRVARGTTSPAYGASGRLALYRARYLTVTIKYVSERQGVPGLGGLGLGLGLRRAGICGTGRVPLSSYDLRDGIPCALTVPLEPQGCVRLVLTLHPANCGIFGSSVAVSVASAAAASAASVSASVSASAASASAASAAASVSGTRIVSPDISSFNRIIPSATLLVPPLVRHCCATVEASGALYRQGLYRVPGSAAAVQALRAHFIRDPNAPLSARQATDVHAVCSLLKSYLRELPQPLLACAADGTDLRPLLRAAAARSENDGAAAKMGAFMRALRCLAAAERRTGVYILRHLHRVLAAADENKMGPNALATCFGPCLLRPSTQEEMGVGSADFAAAMRADNNVVAYLLRQQEVAERLAAMDRHPDPRFWVTALAPAPVPIMSALKRFCLYAAQDASDVAAAATASGGGDKSRNSSTQAKAKRPPVLKFEGFVALCHDLGLYLGPADRDLYDALAQASGKAATHSSSSSSSSSSSGTTTCTVGLHWPAFKRWWELEGRHLELTPQRRKALINTRAYFDHFDVTGTGLLGPEELAALQCDLQRRRISLDDTRLTRRPAGTGRSQLTVSFPEFVRWLASEGLGSPGHPFAARSESSENISTPLSIPQPDGNSAGSGDGDHHMKGRDGSGTLFTTSTPVQ